MGNSAADPDAPSQAQETQQAYPSRNPVESEHLVTAVAGSTLLQIVARPILHPRRRNAALSEEELEVHKTELVRLVQRLLGIEHEPTTIAKQS